jgi:uncharacterized protein GlcG (DUF336 family)
MRSRLLSLTTMVAVAVFQAAGQQTTVKRLDGSKITSAEIDGTVTCLMHATEVTGVGLAFSIMGKLSTSRPMASATKRKICR